MRRGNDWIDALAMEEAREAIADAIEELDGILEDRILQGNLEDILNALDEDLGILEEDLGTISVAINVLDGEEFGIGDRLMEAIDTIRRVYGLEEEKA